MFRLFVIACFLSCTCSSVETQGFLSFSAAFVGAAFFHLTADGLGRVSGIKLQVCDLWFPGFLSQVPVFASVLQCFFRFHVLF